MDNRINLAEDLIKDAGKKIKEMMMNVISVDTKSNPTDFVTNVDTTIETFLVSEILNNFPEDHFLTEEKTVNHQGTKHLWIIDPIDGTTNFIYQKENFCISIAHYHEGKPVFGLVYDVMNNVLLKGIAGLGAYRNGILLEKTEQNQPLRNAIVSGDVYRPGMFSKDIMDIKESFVTHRFLGSGALEIAYIASRRWQAYVFPTLKVWDYAAAVIILIEVGGIYRIGDQINQPYFDDTPRSFIAASNEQIFESLRALV